MKRPELKNYQTKAFHHFDTEAYARDLEKYADYVETASKYLLEALEEVVRHGLIEKDGYESALSKVHNAIQKAKP